MAQYWFRQKRFGYGATPNSWQGWLLTATSVALVLAGVGFDLAYPDKAWLGTILIFAVLVPLVVIVRIKTEGGWRWRWGNDD